MKKTITIKVKNLLKEAKIAKKDVKEYEKFEEDYKKNDFDKFGFKEDFDVTDGKVFFFLLKFKEKKETLAKKDKTIIFYKDNFIPTVILKKNGKHLTLFNADGVKGGIVGFLHN